jgi:hypothetical protein
MVSEQECLNLASELSSKEHTFAEYIAKLFTGKLIELYVGDSYEHITLDQHSSQYPAVFCGKVVGAYKECLIINSVYVKEKQITFGKIILINERSIKALSEVDGKGKLQELFLSSADTVRVIKDLVGK